MIYRYIVWVQDMFVCLFLGYACAKLVKAGLELVGAINNKVVLRRFEEILLGKNICSLEFIELPIFGILKGRQCTFMFILKYILNSSLCC